MCLQRAIRDILRSCALLYSAKERSGGGSIRFTARRSANKRNSFGRKTNRSSCRFPCGHARERRLGLKVKSRRQQPGGAERSEMNGSRKVLALTPLSSMLILLAAGTLIAQNPPEWTEPFPPHKVAGNIYYVGSKGLAAFLITTPQGHILINSNLQESVPQIQASVEKLGFHFRDVK